MMSSGPKLDAAARLEALEAQGKQRLASWHSMKPRSGSWLATSRKASGLSGLSQSSCMEEDLVAKLKTQALMNMVATLRGDGGEETPKPCSWVSEAETVQGDRKASPHSGRSRCTDAESGCSSPPWSRYWGQGHETESIFNMEPLHLSGTPPPPQPEQQSAPEEAPRETSPHASPSGAAGEQPGAAGGRQRPSSPPEPSARPLSLEQTWPQSLEMRGRREEWQIDIEEVSLAEKLGEGDCAVVYKARWRSMVVVAKMLRHTHEHSRDNSCLTADKARADIINEVDILSHLRHPNLVLFLGACLSRDGRICVLSEFMDTGTLEDYFQTMSARTGTTFRAPTEHVLSWALDLGQALCFLHNCSPAIIHRDLKPANLLLGLGMKLKVGDFGLSRVKTHGGEMTDGYRMTGLTGTLRYMAPEVMKPARDGSSKYDEKVDIYSAAQIVWYMCMGEQPFGELGTDTVMTGVIKGLRPDLYSVERRNGKEIADFIRCGWALDPRKRFSAEEMVTMIKQIRVAVREKVKGKWGKRVSPMPLLRKVRSGVSRAVLRISQRKKDPIADRDARHHGSGMSSATFSDDFSLGSDDEVSSGGDDGEDARGLSAEDLAALTHRLDLS